VRISSRRRIKHQLTPTATAEFKTRSLVRPWHSCDFPDGSAATSLVDIRSAPIDEITPFGVKIRAREYELDAIVFATGFDAMTGSLARIEIRNGEKKLRDAWKEGPNTYLGLMTAGFPNLFIITGPGSPSVLAQMILAIEQHVDWIVECLEYIRQHGFARIEAEPDAQARWVDHVNEVASKTLYPSANSWYMGANVPGKPRVFMPYIGGFNVYRKLCEEAVSKGYDGFRMSV
jgi:cyclohexanone monooxygenase